MTMKRIILAGVVGTVLSASQLLGGSIQTWTTAFNGVPDMNGGEFSTSLDGGPAFATFCVELGETFSPGTTYSYSLSSSAVGGGTDNGNTTAGSDPLSAGSAWLFLQFSNGALNPGYLAAHDANAGHMQNAFWALEDEKTEAAAGGAANPYLAMVVAQFGTFALAQADYTGSAVRVINVFDAQGNHQDLIGAVPDGGLTLAMLGMGLAGVGFVARRRN